MALEQCRAPWSGTVNAIRLGLEKELCEPSMLIKIAGAAWASGTESGADLYKLYSTGRIAYEVYQRLKQGGDLRKELLRVRILQEFYSLLPS